MSTSDSQPDLLVNEELVAYLDGELSPEESRRVEERLALDADYRQRLRDFDQAWEALDALPATNVDDHFARTTIEMVAVAAQRDIAERSQKVAAATRSRMLWWLAAGLAVAVLGFAVTWFLLPDPDDTLIANLPVVQQFDALSHLSQPGDVEFLRTLSQQVPLEKLAHDTAAIDGDLKTWRDVSQAPPSQRRQFVAKLSSDQKADLAERLGRFKEMAAYPAHREQLEQIRQLERTVRQDELLQRTLLAYGNWLATRPAWEQEDLHVLSAEERASFVRRLVREDEERALRHLSNEDKTNLRNRILEVYRDRRPAFERAMRRRERDIRIQLHGSELRDALMVIWWNLFLSDEKDDEVEERLVNALSPEQQEYWRNLPERGRGRGNRRRMQLVQWIHETIKPRLGPEDLEKFFTEKLDNNQREQLLKLPSDQFQSQLEKLYLAHELGVQNAAEWLNEFGPGAGMSLGPPGPGGPGGRGGPRNGRRDRDRDRRDGDRPPRDEFGSGPPEPEKERSPERDEHSERQPPSDDPPPPQPAGSPQQEP
jgi:hypothetical protein